MREQYRIVPVIIPGPSEAGPQYSVQRRRGWWERLWDTPSLRWECCDQCSIVDFRSSYRVRHITVTDAVKSIRQRFGETAEIVEWEPR